jgi:PKD repeat protein
MYYQGKVQNDASIALQTSGDDPTGVAIKDGELEFRSANVTAGKAGNWSAWTKVDGNALNMTSFKGDPGKVYQFRLRVVNDHGTRSLYNESSETVRINRGPLAAIKGKVKVTTGEKAFFSAQGSTDPDGDPLNFTWSLPDGKTRTGSDASYRFSKAGTYDMKLTVSDGYTTNTTVVKVVVNAKGLELGGILLPLLLIFIVVLVAIVATVMYLRRRTG